jgi:Polysaccharide deacetylase
MRHGVIAALLTLVLAAIAAEKAAGPGSLIALAGHVISPTRGSGGAVSASASQAAQTGASETPVIDIAQATAAARARISSAAPIALGQDATAPNPPAAKPLPTCNNPDALGLSRVIEIDTTGGPAFGTEHFKQYDFLRDKEVVLTFDDGPWPDNTPMVLKALQGNCIKATFFEIGEHATWCPDLTRELVSAGMTVGSHTWSHKDLAKNPYAKDIEQA